MNLKEAFRFQNKLQRLMDDSLRILRSDENLMQVENTALRHKVHPEAQDETTLEQPDCEYAGQATELTVFLMFLLGEREKLSRAIRSAKASMALDFDGEVSLNALRQEISAAFRHMAELRSAERVIPGGGTGYKFNAEGNQVSYRCDLKQVRTINFDRNKVRTYASGLSKTADAVSAELDRQLVNTPVAYEAPFDVNDSFAEVFGQYLDGCC